MVGKKGPRKLLVASIGVATINYVLAGCDTVAGPTVANLPAPIAGSPPTVANLPAPVGGFPPVGGQAGQNNAGSGGSTGGGDNGGASSQGGAAGDASGGEGGAGGAP